VGVWRSGRAKGKGTGKRKFALAPKLWPHHFDFMPTGLVLLYHISKENIKWHNFLYYDCWYDVC
jgi:hypothetical protein